MKPRPATAVIGGRRYRTDGAALLAGDDYFEAGPHGKGGNYERGGRNTFLYRTAAGAYFSVTQSTRVGEADQVRALELDAAINLFEGLREKRVPFAEAFPGITIDEA